MPVTGQFLRGKDTQAFFDKLDQASRSVGEESTKMVAEQTEQGREVIASTIFELLQQIGLYARMIEHAAHGDEDTQTAEEGAAKLEILQQRGNGHQCGDSEIKVKVIQRVREGRAVSSFSEKFGVEPPFGFQSNGGPGGI